MSITMAPINLKKLEKDGKTAYNISTPTKTAEGQTRVATVAASNISAAREITNRSAAKFNYSGALFVPGSSNYQRANQARAYSGNLTRAGGQVGVDADLMRYAQLTAARNASLASAATRTSASSFYGQTSTANSIGNVIGQVLPLASMAVNSSGKSTRGAEIDNAMSSLSNVPAASADVSGAISKMENSQTSSALRSNIAAAGEELAKLDANEQSLTKFVEQNNIPGLEGQQANLQEEIKPYETEKNTRESVVNSTKKELNSAKEREKAADEAVKGKSAAYDSAVSAYQSAQDATKAAETQVSTCEKGVETCKTELEAAKLKLNPDGTQDTAAIEAAQKALDEAEKALDKAKQDLELKKQDESDKLARKKEAMSDLEKAKDVSKEQIERVKSTTDKVSEQERLLADAETALDKAKQAVQTKQKQLDEISTNLQVAQNQSSMLDSVKANKEMLTESLAKQNKRLEKMVDTESKALTKAEKSGDAGATELIGRKSDSDAIRDMLSDPSNAKQGTDGATYYTTTNPRTKNTFYYKKVGNAAVPITQNMYNRATSGTRPQDRAVANSQLDANKAQLKNKEVNTG